MIFKLLILPMLLMYTRVLKLRPYLINLDSAKLVSVFFTVKPPDFFLEVQFLFVGGGVCAV